VLVTRAKPINIIAFAVIISIGFILTLPAIAYGIFGAHDILLHLNWYKCFADQLWDGELYPRWLLGMNSGLGSPTFFYYAPIPYYFTSLFYLFKLGEVPIWSQLIFSAALALVASGFTAYLWLKDLTNRKIALIGAVIYMSLPYHWAIDIYYRFAFTEYWTFVWIPLILYFSRKMIKGSRLAVPGVAISYALLAMTHLPTTLMFSVLPIFYIAFMTPRQLRLNIVKKMIFAMFLGIGLAAIYLLPAMTMQEYVSLKEIATRPFFYYENNFLLEFNRLIEKSKNLVVFRVYLSILLVLMVGVFSCAFSIARKNIKKAVRVESNYWVIVAIASSFMTLPLSTPVWKLLPMLQKVQFPWRFHVVLTVATTALITIGIHSLNQTGRGFSKKISTIGGLLLITTLFSGFVITYINIGLPNFEVEQDFLLSVDAPEYRPTWSSKEVFEQYVANQAEKDSPKVEVTQGQGSLSIQQWLPRKILLETNATTDVELTLKQLYYPGWTAKIDGTKQLPLTPSQPEGLVRLKVPRGQNQVRVTLEAGVEERLGQVISAVCVVLVLLLIFGFRKVNRSVGG
jgi:hypothetical protein